MSTNYSWSKRGTELSQRRFSSSRNTSRVTINLLLKPFYDPWLKVGSTGDNFCVRERPL